MPKVRVNDLDLFYQDDDFADPWVQHDAVFMQHGFARNSNFWRGWVPWLSREYRVLRMDLRGCGRSGDPGPDYRYSLEGFLDDFTGFLDALGIDGVHYIGESLGGIIGAAAAARHPERIKSLTLVSTPIQVPDGSRRLAAGLGYSRWGDVFHGLGMREWWMKLRESTGELTRDPARDEYFATEFARTPAHVADALSEFAPTVSLADLLPKIAAPTLVLTPETSTRTTRQEQERLARVIPGAGQRIYPGANHGMYYLMPDPLARDTLEFLRSL